MYYIVIIVFPRRCYCVSTSTAALYFFLSACYTYERCAGSRRVRSQYYRPSVRIYNIIARNTLRRTSPLHPRHPSIPYVYAPILCTNVFICRLTE